MIVLDTSALIEMMAKPASRRRELREALEEGERILLPTLVLYEWWRGPRVAEELVAQTALFPPEEAIPFGPEEAAIAAELYQVVRSPRGREVDLAIAACAISWKGALWTLNQSDFKDLPGLRLH